MTSTGEAEALLSTAFRHTLLLHTLLELLCYVRLRSLSSIYFMENTMNTRPVTLLGVILLLANLSQAQGLQDTTTHGDFYKMIGLIQKMMQGAPYEQVKPYASIEGMVISGDTTRHLLEVLKAKDRAAILREDSTRQGIQIIARSNKAEDAIYVVLKTVNAKKEDPRWHSLVLYKEGDTGWQVYLWHVGE